jgi:hypothetical protein
MTLSDTQSLVLSKASQHPERLAAAPPGLPAAARDAVFRAMVRNGLLAECAAPEGRADLAWRADADGTRIALRATAAGLRAIGIEPDGSEAGAGVEAQQDAAVEQAPLPLVVRPVARFGLRAAAERILAAWADDAALRHDLPDAVEALRAALAKPSRALATPRRPHQGTKREQVLGLLRRPEGASVAQVAEATGWAPHTVRGFFAGLRKREGIAVAVLERMRQVGPGKDGAKGSYTVYRIAGAA